MNIIRLPATLMVLMVLVSSSCNTALGQRHLRDSLLSRLTMEKKQPVRVDILNELAFAYYDYDDSLANVYAGESLALAEKIGYSRGAKYANVLLGIGHFAKGDFRNAIGQFNRAIAIEADSSESYDLYALCLTGECLTVIARYDSARRVFERAVRQAKSNHSFWLPRAYFGQARLLIREWENEKALLYLDSARALMDESKPDFRWLELLTNYGEAYNNLVQREESLKAYEKMCTIADSLEDRYHLIKCALNNADHYYDAANYVLALNFAQSALELSRLYTYPVQEAQLLLKIGDIYVVMTDYSLALDYYFRALGIAESLGLTYETALLYNKISWVYKDEGKYDLAWNFANQSMALFTSIGDRNGIADVHNNMGLIYLLQGRYEESVAEHRKALAIRQDIGSKLGVIASLYNEGLVYEEQGLYEKALELNLEVLRLAQPVSNAKGMATSYQRVASLLIAMRRFDEAETYLQKAMQIDKESITRLSRRNNFLLYSRLFEAKADFKTALEYRKQYETLNDSIFSEQSASKIAELQARYDLEQKESEIEALKNQRKLQENQLMLQEAKIQNQRVQIYLAVGFLVVVSSFVLLLVRLNRKLNETKQNLAVVNARLTEANKKVMDVNKNLESKVEERTSQLKQAYVELDTFFYRSSHDFRRPLTTLIGLADVAAITVKEKQAHELFDMVKLTAQNLDKMLHKLQSISDVGAMELSYKAVYLRELITSAIDKHEAEIQRLGVKVIEEVTVKNPISSYPVLISVILDNLIENALDFSSPVNPYVKISASTISSHTVIEVEDNGHGIPDEYRKNIFNMYFKASEKSKGNGLGLFIVAKAVQKLSGNIRVEGGSDRGSRFVVEIPNVLPGRP